MTIDDWFRQQDMSITKLAARIGVTHANASRLVNRKSQPSLRTAQKISLISAGQVGLLDWRSEKDIEDDKKLLD